MNLIKSVSFLAAIALLSACSTAKNLMPKNYDKYQKLPVADAKAMQKELFLESERIKTFRSLVALKISHPQGSTAAKHAISFSKPDMLRVDMFGSSLNQMMGRVVTNKGHLTAIYSDEGSAFKAPASLNSMWHSFGMPFRPREFMSWMCGKFDISFARNIQRVDARMSPEGDNVSLEFDLNDGRRVFLLVDSTLQGYRISQFDVYKDGEKEAVLHSKFDTSSPKLCPKNIKMAFSAQDVEIKARLDRPEINASLKDKEAKIFDLSIPIGFSVNSASDLKKRSNSLEW